MWIKPCVLFLYKDVNDLKKSEKIEILEKENERLQNELDEATKYSQKIESLYEELKENSDSVRECKERYKQLIREVEDIKKKLLQDVLDRGIQL